MAGYYDPQPPKDNWARRLYEEHGLSEASSMEDIEKVARKLREDPTTAWAGAELTLGRRIDGREHKIAMIYMLPGIEAGQKFALLLLQKAIEEGHFRHGAGEP